MNLVNWQLKLLLDPSSSSSRVLTNTPTLLTHPSTSFLMTTSSLINLDCPWWWVTLLMSSRSTLHPWYFSWNTDRSSSKHESLKGLTLTKFTIVCWRLFESEPCLVIFFCIETEGSCGVAELGCVNNNKSVMQDIFNMKKQETKYFFVGKLSYSLKILAMCQTFIYYMILITNDREDNLRFLLVFSDNSTSRWPSSLMVLKMGCMMPVSKTTHSSSSGPTLWHL